MKKVVILVLALVFVGSAVAVYGTILYFEAAYGYKIESAADLWAQLKDPPEYYFYEQGLQYSKLDNGIIVRTDKIDYNGKPTYVDSYGIETWAGTYYRMPWNEMECIWSGNDKDYNYDDYGNLLSIDETTFECYYINLDGKHLILFFSDIIPSDNSGIPPQIFERGNRYIIYFAPQELTEDYKLVYDNDTFVPVWHIN